MSIRIPMPSGRPIELTASNLQADATPSPAHVEASVHVHGPMEFTGNSSTVQYALARPFAIGATLANFDTEAELHDVRAAGDHVVATVIIGAAVRVPRIDIACGDLTLDVPPDAIAAREPTGEDQWVPAHRSLTFRAQPGRGNRVDVAFDPAIAWPVLLVRSEHRGAWAHVRLSQEHGVIDGWVLASEIARPGFSGHASGSSNDGICVGDSSAGGAVNIDFAGPARLRVGTAVFYAENGAQWARVAEPEGFDVTHVRGSDWVRITRVRGITMCGPDLAHAWVRRSDLEVEPASR